MRKAVYIVSIGLCLAVGIAVFYRSGPNPLGEYLGITNTPALESPTPLPTEEITATPTQAPPPTATPIPTQTLVPTEPTQPPIQPTPTATQPPSAPKKTAAPVLPRTGMAINDPSIQSANRKSVMRLAIPTLGLDKPVFPALMNNNSWDISTLSNQVAWLLGTSYPNMGGNTVLVGHLDLNNGADGAFRNLSDMQNGDAIYIFTSDTFYYYIVTEKKTVTPDDIQIIANTPQAQLTLITCDWDSWDPTTYTYTSRLVIVARLYSSQKFNH